MNQFHHSRNTQKRATNLQNHRKQINQLMYMNEIKIFIKNEKETENLTQTIRIYSWDIGMEFIIKKISYAYSEKGEKKQVKEN